MRSEQYYANKGTYVARGTFVPSPRRRLYHPQDDAAAPVLSKLDAFNAQQEGGYLHPTKGWRKVSVQRSRAEVANAQLIRGKFARLPAALWCVMMRGNVRRFIVEGV